MRKQEIYMNDTYIVAHYLHDNYPIMPYMSLLHNAFGDGPLNILWGRLIGTQGGMKSELSLSELDIYGSKRLGVIKDTMVVNRFYFNGAYNPTSSTYDITSIDTPIYNAILPTNLASWYYGKKVFELSNHLGNVLATVSDYKIPYLNTNGKLCFNPDVRTETRYYAYGGKKDSSFNSNKYRFKYQGSEINDGVDGTFNTYYRWGDNDGKLDWWSIDPKYKASESGYVLMGRNPIWHNDPMGDIIKIKDGLFKSYTYKNEKLYNKRGKEVNSDKVSKFVKATSAALTKIRSVETEGKNEIETLENSKFTYRIVSSKNITRFEADNDDDAGNSMKGSGGIIRWQSDRPNSEGLFELGNRIPISRPFVSLFHELYHGVQANNGTSDKTGFMTPNEWEASFHENMFRAKLGLPFREFYGKEFDKNTKTYIPGGEKLLRNGQPYSPIK